MVGERTTVAILGGTGALGTGLALRWAAAGHRVFIGSRDLEKARGAATDIRRVLETRGVQAIDVEAMDNTQAARAATLVALTVPYAHHASTLLAVKDFLQGKILIDVTVPLRPPKVGTVQLPAAGSAAQEAQALLGPGVRVVSAFQNVAAHHLSLDQRIECDVLVSGDDAQAREAAIELVAAAGMRGFHAGPLANAAAAEALTSVLIQINRQFKCHAGIRITGLDNPAGDP